MRHRFCILTLVALGSAGVARADAPPKPRPLAAIDDLPPLALARPKPAKVAASAKLNTDGYKLHAAKDFAGASQKYKAAVVADPGNLLARYNLASVLVSGGDPAHGLAVLAQFKGTEDCRACIGILIHARTDGEWASQKDVPGFVAATRDAVADTIDMEKIANQVADLLRGKGTTKGLAPYFHPRQAAQLVRGDTRFETPEELARWGKKMNDGGPSFLAPDSVSCSTKTSCCQFSSPPTRSDTLIEIGSVCFEGVGGVLFVGKISISSYLSSLPMQ